MNDSRHFSIGLAEVALRVSDVKSSLRFYTDVVGLEPDVVGDDFAFLWAEAPGRPQRVILLHKDLPPRAFSRADSAEAPASGGLTIRDPGSGRSR